MKKLIVLLIAVTVVAASSVTIAETVYFDDGQSHTIDTRTHNSYHLDKNNSSFPISQIDLVDGGSVDRIYSYNNSWITISGGLADALYAFDNTFVIMNDGSVTEDFEAYGNSKIYIFGGTAGALWPQNNSHVTMYGGTAAIGPWMADSSKFTMMGGTLIGGLWTWQDTQAKITGGTVEGNIIAEGTSTIELSGGSFDGELTAYSNGTIYLEGTGFQATDLDGNTTDLSYGDRLSWFGTVIDPYGWDASYVGSITGTLADGSILDSAFRVLPYDVHSDFDCNADIIIIPEPASILLFGLGGLVFRRKR